MFALLGKHHTIIEEYGDKNKIYYESSFSPIYNHENIIIGAAGFTRDVTEINLLNQQRDESEKKYRLLSDMMPLSIVHYQIITDVEKSSTDFVILNINKEFEDLVDMKSAELVGKKLWDVFPETEQYWIDEFEKVASSGKMSIFEDYSVVVDMYLKIHVYKIKENEIAAIMENVTEDRKNREELIYLSEY